MSFGQIVIGPPGSGKTMYCHAMCNFLKELGRSVTKLIVELLKFEEKFPLLILILPMKILFMNPL